MTRLDGDIVSFSNLQRVTLADGVFGVYVDGLQESGAMVTELIYWEDGQLNAPFYAPEDNLTAITWRESGIPLHGHRRRWPGGMADQQPHERL